MRYLFSIFVSILFFINVTAQSVRSIADSNNLFALNLYSELSKQEPGNLFFSPFSISTALAMTYAGARNETEKQMCDVLHFNLAQKEFHCYRHYLDAIEADTGKNLVLEIANSIWVANSCKIRPSFSEIVKDDYNSESKNVDFAGHTEQARQEINSWVENKTQDKIKDLITQGMIKSSTKLVLVNTIYFKAKWESPFNSTATRKAIFHPNDSISDSASFMNKAGYYEYYKDSNLQVLEIPYYNGKISMLILLPNKANGINNTENKLDEAYYSKIVKNLSDTSDIRLSLPKFKITLGSILNTPLSEMGMPVAFSGDADFSGIASGKLNIGFVIHKAFIDVSEEGTEAAAATAVGIMLTSAGPPRTPPIPFNANHPFIFIIKDGGTGSILFMGKITDPTKE